MKQQNKRNIQRFSFAFNVYDKDGNLLGVTKNISSDGFFLETKKNINKDALNISIELPRELGTLSLDCTVVRNEDTGIGTKLFLDDENRKNFSRMIENLNE
ncbi:MAG TPA: PilZ domain-containing protein [Nitrospinota bacterium]|jgi:hypothetical protein|nr:PilZ domain-containing protein [Nitrospinota bacterium]